MYGSHIFKSARSTYRISYFHFVVGCFPYLEMCRSANRVRCREGGGSARRILNFNKMLLVSL
jgi:hypothetical protein